MKKYQRPTTELWQTATPETIAYSVGTDTGSGRQHGGAKEWFSSETETFPRKDKDAQIQDVEDEPTTILSYSYNIWDD